MLRVEEYAKEEIESNMAYCSILKKEPMLFRNAGPSPDYKALQSGGQALNEPEFTSRKARTRLTTQIGLTRIALVNLARF
jgi:hypothetical protein